MQVGVFCHQNDLYINTPNFVTSLQCLEIKSIKILTYLDIILFTATCLFYDIIRYVEAFLVMSFVKNELL